MDTATVLCILGLLLRISVAVPAHSWDESDLSMASVVVKEGESAEISCMLKESNVAYFWLKGGSLENSTVVGSFISDITVNDPDDPFTVTENGSLIIKKVSRNDEGNYICRVSSEEISCHGDVFVFVQAALQDFQLAIEYCEPENSCVISTESTKPTSLTCKATNASPSMKLKWFNGSHEIKDNIEENSLTKEASKEISSTIRDVYKAPSTLTCQAVDFKRSNDDGMFAHVQFRTPAATADISPGWIVTAILFIVGFVILFLIIISITVWPKLRKGKDVETQNSAERESLLSKDKELQDKRQQISKLENNIQIKDDELKTKTEEINELNKALTETKAEQRVDGTKVTSKDKELQDKREQISKLENNIQTKDDELKTKTEEINELNKALSETKAAQRVDEAKVTSKDKELQDKQEQISKLEKSLDTVTGKLLKTNEEHQTQKDSLNKKDLEIQQLRSNLEHVEKELTKNQNREQEISSKEAELGERETKMKEREFEMNLIESKLRDRETNVKERENYMNSKEQTLAERETKVKRREDNMDLTKSTLKEMENNVKKSEDYLMSRDSSLKEKENNIKKRENEVIPKEKRLAVQEAEIKKKSLDLERKSRKFRIDQMDSKDSIRLNCKLITSKTGDDSRVYTKEKGGQAEVKAKKWKFSTKDAKFHTVYPTNAKPVDLCQSIDDIIEHAIDGKMSCLIAHDASRREHWKTMFGPEGASDAILPYAITTIFRRNEELTSLGYKIDVTARFQTTSTGPTNFERVMNEQNVFKLLKKGKIDQVEGSMDHFVQFFIKTKIAEETLTGSLILATVGSIQMIKECFHAEEPKNPLARNISEITSDIRCRSVLITHIHEDEVDKTNDCLAMVNAISKKNKK